MQTSAAEGSAGGVWAGRVKLKYALDGVVELFFCEDRVRVFDIVHVQESWCLVEKSRMLVLLDVVVYLDGSAASVLPCIESVGGGEGSNCFDGVGELCLGRIRPPWARACMGSGIVGK